ncbi:UDP-glucose 4-epimerase [Pseudoalteromonas luteoviolacea B = ATCC 29581]|nr:UDP-glucose 4-epimerase [Pseudoalteromonas luteoviolacea B = ATCC 29581]
MKALVTGGAGFIGSHMVDFLVNQNIETTIVDNLVNGRLENLAQHSGKITFYNVDISNKSALDSVKFGNFDFIFHFAALADIVPSIDNPMAYHAANVEGTLNVLELAKRCSNLKKFIYAASSSCYGIPKQYPTPEETAIQPQYPYALTKRIGEEYALHWGKVYNIPVISTRFFNVYGPRHRTSGTYGAVFGVFLAQLINKKPLTIVGDGFQTRDFTFVTDVVEACYKAATSNFRNEIFNVGSGNTYSVNQLAELLGGEKTYIPKRPGEPDCTFADISKITSMLDWQPKVKFDEGVKLMLDNIDFWKDAPVWNAKSIEQATSTWFEKLS